ncbi:MAG: dihydrolipoamide acetyltransferase family protein [Pelolinea sp.]|nr:dihydrolipoamide acetyltransferase family protein [Pelolinea sp.]
MASKVIMPQGGQDLTTGRVVRWLKKEGEAVKKGEVICEVETEKAVFEVSAPQNGVMLQITAHDGEEVKILSTIGFVGDAAESIGGAAKEPVVDVPRVEKTSNAGLAIPLMQQQTRPKIIISPKARKLARDNALPLESLLSSRADGKITSDDVLKTLGKTGQLLIRKEAVSGAARTITPDKVRKTIAKRLSQSWSSAPHIFVTVAVDMTSAVKFRKENLQLDVSYNDLVIRACAMALQKYPDVNASFIDEDTINLWGDINIGVAIAAPQGLVVPVIDDADKLSLKEIAVRSKQIVEKARAGKQDLSKPSRFTISNLGMYQVEAFTAVINPPETAILAVSSIRKMPVVVDEDKIAIRDMMNVTLSMDHRVGDGVLAAEFVNAVKQALENPETLL